MKRPLAWLLGLTTIGGAAIAGACGGTGDVGSGSGGSGGSTGNTGGGGGNFVGSGGNGSGSLHIEPPMVTLDIDSPGAAKQQTFKLYDGKMEVAGLWTLDQAGIGAINQQGSFATTGGHGGVVHVIATAGTSTAQATVTVNLHMTENPGMVPPNLMTALDGGGNADPKLRWLYPYDKTLWPRGLKPPVLQLDGTPGDAFLVEVDEPHLKYKGYFGAASPSAIPLSVATWDAIAKSAGAGEAVTVKVTKSSAGAVSGPVTETWSIAQGSVKGSVFYNTYDQVPQVMGQGAVLRIPVGQDVQLFKRDDGTCNVCHSVSARGNVMVVNVGFIADPNPYSAAFDVTQMGAPRIGPKQQSLLYPFAGLSPDGSLALTGIGGYDQVKSALWDIQSGAELFDVQGKLGFSVYMPTFSFDAKKVVYGKSGASTVSVMDFDQATKTLSNPVDLYTDPSLFPAWPVMTPDDESIVFNLGTDHQGETRSNCKSDLFSIDVASKALTRLDALNGYDANKMTYLPYGADEVQLNYEPTMLPVAKGGYYWVVFTSRRDYGNRIYGGDPYSSFGGPGHSARKKLWLAAIDAHAKPGVDPSHPAIYLDGQDPDTANMRGFWALDPCRADGQTCESGDDCCGGACRQDANGDFTCGKPMGCSHESESCKVSSDCCDPKAECLGGYCSNVSVPK
jgi:hypothetical protein